MIEHGPTVGPPTTPAPEEDLGRAWCRTCRRMQDVEDRFLTDVHDDRGEVEVAVVVLACEHRQHDETGTVIAPAPPYVGTRAELRENGWVR